jgi:hypothetical protein
LVAQAVQLAVQVLEQTELLVVEVLAVALEVLVDKVVQG